MRAPRCLLVIALALGWATPAAAEPGVWTGGGPPAGVVGPLAVDPVEPRILYGGGFGSVFVSEDGAGSWQRVGEPGALQFGISSLVVDPAAHETLYALAASDLYRSRDAGETWTRLDGAPGVSTFALLPGSPSTLLAGTFEDGLLRSSDGGRTWTPSGEGIADPNAVFWLGSAPSDPSVVYALAGEALYRSADGGRTWAAARLPGEGGGFFGVQAVDPADAGTLYLGGFTGLYRSADGGQTWSFAGAGLPSAEEGFVAALAAAPSLPSRLYAVTDRALFRSDDAGRRWRPVNDDAFARVAPWTIAVDPTDPDRVYRPSGQGVFLSTDGGETFVPASVGLPGLATQAVAAGPGEAVYAGLVFGGVASSADGGVTWALGVGDDVDAESITAVAADPLVAGRAYAGSYSGRFFRSFDGGRRWDALGERLPSAILWGLAPDPARRDRLLAATEVGVFRSADAGERWRRSSRGLPNAGVRTLAFAPSAPAVVYAGLERAGAFRSADGGRTWRAAGLGRHTVLSLAVDPGSAETVYAATKGGGLFHSGDGGRSWRRLAATGLTAAVALDPAAPATVLLASASAVRRSTGGGAAFEPYQQGLPATGGTPADPESRAPLTVVALAAVPGGAFLATWAGVFSVRFA